VKLSAGHFYGRTLGCLRAGGFSFTEQAYDANTRVPKHAHEFAHLCFILEGSCTEGFHNETAEHRPSSLTVCPADVEHWEQHHTAGRQFLIEIETSRFQSIYTERSLHAAAKSLKGGAMPVLAARLYREFRQNDQYSPLALEGIALELLARIMRQANRGALLDGATQRRVAVVLDILRDDFPVLPRLSSLAEAAGIHPVYLATAFRKSQGCTIGEYMRGKRVEHARKRLTMSNDSLVQIAIESGFADQTHLTRSFKQITGMTPAQYRRTFRPS
jgi:AraC family transcriptional regulator